MKKLMLFVVVLAIMVPLAAMADTIDLGTPNLGGCCGQPVPGQFTFTGDGAGNFSAINWAGWIGNATGPGLITGVYSFQGSPLTGTYLGVLGGVQVWSLGGGPDTFWYNDTIANLGTNNNNYLSGNVTFTTLSCSGGNCHLQGTIVATGGLYAPGTVGSTPIILDLTPPSVDLAALGNGQDAYANISTGEIVIPEPGTLTLFGSGLGLLASMFRRKRS